MPLFSPCPWVSGFVQMNDEFGFKSHSFMETKAEQTLGTEHRIRETLKIMACCELEGSWNLNC